MNSRIIYPTDNGGVAVIIPANTIEECIKDIPEGVEYAIVDITDFPLELDAQENPVLDEFGVVKHDRTFRNAWEYTA
jgi:hypothetical protein